MSLPSRLLSPGSPGSCVAFAIKCPHYWWSGAPWCHRLETLETTGALLIGLWGLFQMRSQCKQLPPLWWPELNYYWRYSSAQCWELSILVTKSHRFCDQNLPVLVLCVRIVSLTLLYSELGPVHIWQLLLKHIPGRPNYDQEWSIAIIIIII